MKSKERVLTAVAHQEPDRVPIGFIGCNGAIESKLQKYFGTQDLVKALGTDFRRIGAPYSGSLLHEEIKGINVSVWGTRSRWIEHESGGYWEVCEWPLKDASLEEVSKWPMPNPDSFDYSGISSFCRDMEDYCVVCGCPSWPDIINGTSTLRTMEQVLIDLISDEEAGLLLIDRLCDVQLGIAERTLESAKGGIDLMWLGEDLGTQRGPVIGLELFRKHIRPRIQKFVDLAKSYDIPTMIHSCGSSSWAFDDFIQMGIKAADTLQPEAVDMSPVFLKERYGGKLAFHGCISTAGVLAYGTPDEVASNIRETLEIMKPGGGYILAPTHSVQDNTPVENVIAMLEAARKYGVYGK
jgi:uroporphyrinogen decarboxylase